MRDRDSQGRFLKGIPHPPKMKFINIEYCKKKYLEGYSCFDISKKFNVSERTIRNRFNKIGFKMRKNSEHTERIKQKIKNTLIKKGIKPKVINRKAWNKGITATPEMVKILKANRAKQIFPKKDTKIEVKIRNFLEELKIEYFQHKYMNIKNAYQCDFFIPHLNLVVECDGTYWHKYPTGRDIDHVRTKQLMEKGFKVLRLWEFEINDMTIDKFKGMLK